MKSKYEDIMGKVNTPEKHLDWCIYQARQTGRTHKMVESFPGNNQKFAVLVHVHAFEHYIKKLIKELTPDIDIKNVKFMSYWNDNYKMHLTGQKMPVFVDNSVMDIMQTKFVQELNREWNMKNDRIYRN